MKLFERVHCKAYMAKHSDGIHMEVYNSEFCVQPVHKVYRKRKEEEFDGFLVGVTHLKCEEYGYDGRGFYHFIKTTTYNPKVGVVYFKNNCKRYVLLEDMEIIE